MIDTLADIYEAIQRLKSSERGMLADSEVIRIRITYADCLVPIDRVSYNENLNCLMIEAHTAST
jgi:hypothetical protein